MATCVVMKACSCCNRPSDLMKQVASLASCPLAHCLPAPPPLKQVGRQPPGEDDDDGSDGEDDEGEEEDDEDETDDSGARGCRGGCCEGLLARVCVRASISTGHAGELQVVGWFVLTA